MAGSETENVSSAATERAEKLRSMLRIVRSEASNTAPEVRLSGVTAYKKNIQVKARLTRPVQSLNVREGRFVKAGESLVTLASENIHADISEAEAALKQRSDDFKSFTKLRRTRDVAENIVTQAEAALKQAEAKLLALKRDKSHLTVTAPFDAYVNRIPVREGDVVIADQTVLAYVFDPASFILQADIPERLLGRLDTKAVLKAEAADGSVYHAAINYISASGNLLTRTFALEAQVTTVAANDVSPQPAGLTVTLFVPLKTSRAHRVPSSALALDKAGRIGLKVKENDRAVFYPVQIIDSGDSSGRVFVEGLPSSANIIMTGHAYIAENADLSGVPVTPTSGDDDNA